MARYFLLMLMVCMITYTEAEKSRKNQGGGGGGGGGNGPNSGRDGGICGRDTSKELKADLNEAYEQAHNWLLEQRTRNSGWPRGNTAAAIIALQLSNDTWFSWDDLASLLSVKQLEVELLSHLLRAIGSKLKYIEEMRMMPNCSQYRDGMNSSYDRDDMHMRPNSSYDGDDMYMRPNSSYDRDDMHMRPNMSRNGSDEMKMMPNIPPSDIAHYIIALQATCHNVSNFHNHNLLKILAMHLDEFPQGNFNNSFHYGFDLLTLCQHGAPIKPEYILKLFGPDMMEPTVGEASMILLAMSCIKDQVPEEHENQFTQQMRRIADYLSRSTTMSYAVKTALKVQALLKAEVPHDRWNCEADIRSILDTQTPEGDFGGLNGTIPILPLLAGKTIADVMDVRPDCGDGRGGRPGGRRPN